MRKLLAFLSLLLFLNGSSIAGPFAMSGAGASIGSPITGATATRILFSSGSPAALSDSANATFVSAGTNGTWLNIGAGTIQAYGNSGYAGIVINSTISPFLEFNLSGTRTARISTDVSIAGQFAIAVGSKIPAFTLSATAGEGAAILAGTATTDVAALSITRTNNDASVVKGIDVVFTDTASNAGFLPLSIKGGAAGATSLLSLGKAGAFAVAGASDFFNFRFSVVGGGAQVDNASIIGISSSNASNGSADIAFSRLGAGIFAIGTGAAGSVAGTLAAKGFNAYTQTTDAAPPVPIYKASNAYAQATVNTSGADAVFAAGIGRRFATVVDYTLIDAGADTITITVNGTATVGTADASVQDGTHWVIGASNNATATNIATWMSTISGVSGAANGASAYLTATTGQVHTLTIATNMDAGEGTVTSGANGLIRVGTAVTAAAVAANFSASHYIPIKDGLGTTYYLPVDSAAW